MAKKSDSERIQTVQARRSGIQEAAAKLFAEKGYHGTTTREIAEAAGVAEGTIYNYFANKEDLLVSMLNYLSIEQQRGSEIASALNLPLREALRAMFRTTVSEAKQNMAMAATVYSEALVNPTLRERYVQQRVEPLAALLEQHLRAHIDHGEAREVNVSLVVRIALAAQMGLAMLLLLGDRALETASVDELVEALVDVFDSGLGVHYHTPER
jgi:AcrR family transcriptional regulator